jgi:GTPase Era involved in 16S rRNA processing
MREVVLEYNPVTRACRTMLGGTPIAHLDQKYGDKGRIQGWIGAYLSELPELVNEDTFGLRFKGTSADFEDVQAEVERVTGNGAGLTIEVARLDDAPAGLDLQAVHATFASVLERVRAHEVFADAASFIESVEQLLHRNQFRVAVIATMSSGKSTLLNALIGKDLLPSGTQATTAILTYVHDVDGKPDASARCFNADGRLLATHELADRSTLKGINDPLRRESELEVEDDARVVRIDLELDVPAIDSPAAGQLVLIDTPGPNAAGNPQHHEVTYRLLEPGLEEDLDSEGADAVLYLMDYTRMAVNDDRDLLRDVAAMIRKGGIAAHDRFIFVVNRVNEHDDETDGALSDGMSAAGDFLTEFADIQNPVLIPVDALGALYSRRLQQGEELAGRARRRYADHAEILLDELDINAVARCSPAVAGRVRAEGDGATTEYERVLARSGVTMLEEYLRHYREKYWFPLKLQRVHTRLDRRLLVEERVKRDAGVASRSAA